jgi:hypothetical protein
VTPLTRADVESLWEHLNSAAFAAKDPNIATFELKAFYESLDPSDRVVVDQLLDEWLLSDDDDRRFDAEALIRKFTIRSALPALRLALKHVASAEGPSTAFDRRTMLERLITELEQAPEPD